MTEELTYCVRGCVSPCECQACQECAQPIHAPTRREADEGLLCKRCARTLRKWLTEIPDLYATLDPYHAPPTDEDPDAYHGKHGKLSGSPSPVRLDVVALMDPRTNAGVPGDPWDGSTYIPGEVCTWAQVLVEDHDLSSPYGTLTEAAALLLAWFGTVIASPWVDEMWTAMRDIHRLLQRAHGVPRPKPIGECINVYERGGVTIACGHTLYAPAAGAKIRCSGCGRRYDGYGLVALGKTLEASGDPTRQAGNVRPRRAS